jgi:perosamine synthetase
MPSPITVPLFRAHLPADAPRWFGELLRSERLAAGPNNTAFEEGLGRFLGNPRVLGVSDVSAALTLALCRIGVGPGDEVVMSPLVCLSTSCPVLNRFATVRWCDVDPRTGNLDPLSLKAAMTSRTKAIVLYHWAGYPGDVSEINRIAAERGIPVIEDAGEALGADYQGQRIGNTASRFTVFSFYPNRHLTTIEGGAIACRDQQDYEALRWLRRYGIHLPSFRDPDGEINPGSDITEAGYNYYLNHIAATLGLRQLPTLDSLLAKYINNGYWFDTMFAHHPACRPLGRPPATRPSYWVYTLLCSDRESARARLSAAGVATTQLHIRNDIYSCFGGKQGPLPGVEAFSRQVLCVPCGWWVDEAVRQKIFSALT